MDTAGRKVEFAGNGPAGERIERNNDTLVIRFPKDRSCLSTSWLNGGCRRDIVAVFNHRIPSSACESCQLPGGDVRTYLATVAERNGLDPARSSGLLTKADMANAAYARESSGPLSVLAIVTGGIDINGGRAGDPASYYETDGRFEPVGGTINTILLIGAALPDFAMARAFMTATEAKTAAIQQLMGRSRYSTGIATGSGTDMIAVIADPGSRLRLTDAGKHSKLGELIGKSVIAATVSALEKETGLSAGSQHNVLVRLSRYNVTGENLWETAVRSAACGLSDDTPTKDRFFRCLTGWAEDPAAVALVAAALHVVDESEWGLISRAEACNAVRRIVGDDVPGVPGRTAGSPLQILIEALAGQLSGKL